MVRAGRKNYLFDDFIESDLIAIGWNDLGDLSKITSLSELKKRLSLTYPEYKEQAVHMNAGQINRFVREIKKGDYAVSYNSAFS